MAFELLEHTSVLGSMLFFYLERGIYILKEALERIRLAEEQNKEAERAMIDELDHYQIEKQQALQAIQTQQKNTSHVVKHFQYVFQQSFFDHHDSRDFVELARPLRLGQACHRVFLCLEPIAV